MNVHLPPDKKVNVDFRRGKPAGAVIADALRCYAAYPVLFAELTLTVVLPYGVLVYLIAGAGLLGPGRGSASSTVVVGLLDVLLVGPLISALHIHALTEIAEGATPRVADVFTRGLRVLAVVTAAQVVAGIATAIGFVFLIIPGLLLLARWGVVAQVAAVQRTDWLGALRGSAELTAGSYLHVLGVLISVGLINAVITQLIGAVIINSAIGLQVVLGILIETATLSFGALTGAMLYFDLRGRRAGNV